MMKISPKLELEDSDLAELTRVINSATDCTDQKSYDQVIDLMELAAGSLAQRAFEAGIAFANKEKSIP